MGIATQLRAQSQLRLRIAYNAQSKRYEVYTNPNFTNPRYTRGSSQITVVVPKEVADAAITGRSISAGFWVGQSMVFSPASAPNSDFHSFSSQGDKVDMVTEQDRLLFDFTLPQGFLEGLRLFDPAEAPNSAAAGMRGGDFRSYVSDGLGDATLVIDTKPASLSTQNSTPGSSTSTGSTPGSSTSTGGTGAVVLGVDEEIAPSVQVVAYPNPSATGTVRLLLKGFKKAETLRLEWASVSGRLLKQTDETVEKITSQ